MCSWGKEIEGARVHFRTDLQADAALTAGVVLQLLDAVPVFGQACGTCRSLVALVLTLVPARCHVCVRNWRPRAVNRAPTPSWTSYFEQEV